MTRMLYWNLENFSLAKINNAAARTAAATRANTAKSDAIAAARAAGVGAGLAAVAGDMASDTTLNRAGVEADNRFSYLVEQVMRGPAGGPPNIPDIIVVVEVFKRGIEEGIEGSVLDPGSSSGMAVLALLGRINTDAILNPGLGPNTWCVVPPLLLGEGGKREAVAVFFNSTTLQFTGPNLYWNSPGNNPQQQSQPIHANTFGGVSSYPDAWANALPNRQVNFPVLGNISEKMLAGEWQYYEPDTLARRRDIPPRYFNDRTINRIAFPFNNDRGPFQVRFRELTNLQRTLNLFAVHTSPAVASQAIRKMEFAPAMAGPALANQVNIIFGDFNIDTFSGNAEAYTWLLRQYTLALDARVNGAGNVNHARKPYCMTHLLRTGIATPYNNNNMEADAQHNSYPRYGYMGTILPGGNGISTSGAIDNFFVAHGANARPLDAHGQPLPNNITVINTITGTPYSTFPAGPGITNELRNGLPFNTSMNFNILAAPPAGGGITSISAEEVAAAREDAADTAAEAAAADAKARRTGSAADIAAAAAAVAVATAAANYAAPKIAAAAAAAAAELQFQQWENFGKVYSTSDHLPLMMDI